MTHTEKLMVGSIGITTTKYLTKEAVMKLSVTTIRHDLTKQQLADIMTMYQTDENLIKRVDIELLKRRGKSRMVVEENGMKISTVVKITGE